MVMLGRLIAHDGKALQDRLKAAGCFARGDNSYALQEDLASLTLQCAAQSELQAAQASAEDLDVRRPNKRRRKASQKVREAQEALEYEQASPADLQLLAEAEIIANLEQEVEAEMKEVEQDKDVDAVGDGVDVENDPFVSTDVDFQDQEAEDGLAIVERIVDCRKRGRSLRYQVKWQGHSELQWVAECQLSAVLRQEFHNERSQRSGGDDKRDKLVFAYAQVMVRKIEPVLSRLKGRCGSVGLLQRRNYFVPSEFATFLKEAHGTGALTGDDGLETVAMDLTDYLLRDRPPRLQVNQSNVTSNLKIYIKWAAAATGIDLGLQVNRGEDMTAFYQGCPTVLTRFFAFKPSEEAYSKVIPHPSQFWENKEVLSRMPELFTLASWYLALQASTGDLERSFTHLRETFGPRKGNIGEDQVEREMLCSANRAAGVKLFYHHMKVGEGSSETKRVGRD